MDVTGSLLWVIVLVALCISVLSWIQLSSLVTPECFWGVIVADLTLSPVGMMLPHLCARDLVRTIELLQFYSSMTLSLMASVSIVCYDRVNRMNKSSIPDSDDVFMEKLVRTVFVAFGMSMAVNIMMFMVYYFYCRESVAIHKVVRQLRRRVWNPEPRLELVTSLQGFAGAGECAICLDDLSSLPPELSVQPWGAHLDRALCSRWCSKHRPSLRGRGLLRLSCQHTFHGCCADGWLSRGEARCPVCRQTVGRMQDAICYCIPARKPGAWAWSSVVPADSSSAALEAS